MSRIFLSLAGFALALLATNLIIGLSIGDYNGTVSEWREQAAKVRTLERRRPSPPEEELAAERNKLQQLTDLRKPQGSRVRMHWLFGLTAGLITILVNSITVTYFVGTSRWCKEVCDAYHLDPTPADQSARLKRRTFPWAVCGMLVIVGLAALGAASEPGNSLVERPADWVIFHFTAALLSMAFIGTSFAIQANNIAANYSLIQGIMSQVKQIREERGLEST